MKDFAGLNAGKSCASMIIVVFFEMLRAVFAARLLTMKLPKPRRKTSSFSTVKLLITSSINASTQALTSILPTPVLPDFFNKFCLCHIFIIIIFLYQ